MAKRATPFMPAYSNDIIERFINCIMQKGKKSTSRKIFQGCIEIIKTRGYSNPQETFEKAFRNVMPTMEVKAKRIGGSVYQIPVEVLPGRQRALAFRWILSAAREKSGAPLARRLANEIIEACEGTGSAVKKKEDSIKMAQANKAFAHMAKY